MAWAFDLGAPGKRRDHPVEEGEHSSGSLQSNTLEGFGGRGLGGSPLNISSELTQDGPTDVSKRVNRSQGGAAVGGDATDLSPGFLICKMGTHRQPCAVVLSDQWIIYINCKVVGEVGVGGTKSKPQGGAMKESGAY